VDLYADRRLQLMHFTFEYLWFAAHSFICKFVYLGAQRRARFGRIGQSLQKGNGTMENQSE
jgi:hypothetical protein